jgi:hypothetical protein
VEAVKEMPAPGMQKPSLWGRRKTAPRHILGCSCCNGRDTSGSENQISWLQLDHLGGRRWRGHHTWAPQSDAASWTTRCDIHSHACLEVAHGDGLLPQRDLEGEGGVHGEGGIGTVIERVERGDNAAALDPDKAGAEEISWELARQLATQIVSKFQVLK